MSKSRVSLLELFLTFAKVGVMTFGGGYAMLPILDRELIEKRGWATNEELMDYYAVSQWDCRITRRCVSFCRYHYVNCRYPHQLC